jgi:Putative Actinobacterial Holin-X, holin superfamily III
MTTDATRGEPPDLSALLTGLARTSETLLQQQVDLLRSELKQELNKAGGAAVALAAGSGLVAAGGVYSTLMLVHLLQRVTRLPLWACYGLVAGGLGAAGINLILRGRRTAERVQLDLPQTTAGLKENLGWLKDQVTGPA